jgi:hypothetical protein
MTRQLRSEASEQYRQLRVIYDAAFANWIEQVKRADVESPADQARIEAAHEEYSHSRNLLAEFLLKNHSRPSRPADVEQLAYRIWDHAGRPVGTAEADWHEAEQLVALQTAARPR